MFTFFKALKSIKVWKCKRGAIQLILCWCPPGSSEGTISMQEGEVLAVVEEDKGDGWTRVRRSNGDEGYIPTSYATINLNKWPTATLPYAASAQRLPQPWSNSSPRLIIRHRALLSSGCRERDRKRKVLATCLYVDFILTGFGQVAQIEDQKVGITFPFFFLSSLLNTELQWACVCFKLLRLPQPSKIIRVSPQKGGFGWIGRINTARFAKVACVRRWTDN